MERLKEKADAIISIEGTEYALYKSGPMHKYPYIVDLSTGEIPYNMQRTLLSGFLTQKSVDTGGKTTHWCIRRAIEIALN